MEQDWAYEESLKADREKDRLREEKRLMQKLELESKAAEKERVKREKKITSWIVPEEPDASSPSCLLSAKLGSRTITRKFSPSNSIQDVHNWIFSQLDSPEKFEIITSYPRKTLQPSADVTLTQAGLAAREMLLIRDLDA